METELIKKKCKARELCITIALERAGSRNRLKRKKTLRINHSGHEEEDTAGSTGMGNRDNVNAVSYILINTMQLCSELSRLGRDYRQDYSSTSSPLRFCHLKIRYFKASVSEGSPDREPGQAAGAR